MINELLNQHKYSIIIVLTLLLSILVILVYSLTGRSVPDTDNPETSYAEGEPIEYDIETIPSPTPDESTIGDTGYMEDTYTTAESRQIDQINDLREKSPIDVIDFVVDYNYETFQFDVIVYEPYEESEAAFRSWRSQRYPDIPEETFVFLRQ